MVVGEALARVTQTLRNQVGSDTELKMFKSNIYSKGGWAELIRLAVGTLLACP